jgi:hypothetical protein
VCNKSNLYSDRTDFSVVNDHARGYPNLGAFLDSDDGFAVYRRFGYLQSRILLRKQEELRVLEEKLETTEKYIQIEDDHALCYRELFCSQAAKHGEILDSIEKTYCSYGISSPMEVTQVMANLSSKNLDRGPTDDVFQEAIR